MNVEIGAEAAQFPEKEYINVIAVAVYFNMPPLKTGSTHADDLSLLGSSIYLFALPLYKTSTL